MKSGYKLKIFTVFAKKHRYDMNRITSLLLDRADKEERRFEDYVMAPRLLYVLFTVFYSFQYSTAS